MNQSDLEAIRKSSASLDWTDPTPSSDPADIAIEPVHGTRKVAVLWKDSQGNQRIYGAVGGRWMRNPVITQQAALSVRAHLLSKVA